MTRKTLTTGLLVVLFDLNGLGLLGWAHLHDVDGAASHHAGDCAVCQALSGAGQSKAVLETPQCQPRPSQSMTPPSECPRAQVDTPIATLYRRGPPPSA